MNARGYTLIETAVATIIVALGVLSILVAQHAFHQQTDGAQSVATGLNLANEIREITLNLPLVDPITGQMTFGPEVGEADVTQYDDLDDFAGPNGMGLTFSPPIDALRRPIDDLDRWSQVLTVENVAPGDVGGEAQVQHSTDLMRMTVIIRRMPPGGSNPVEVTRLNWLSAGGS